MIVFDFDGVIGNSIYDSFLTALNAYIEIVPQAREELAGPIEPASSVFKYIETYPEIFQQFEQLIPLGNHAEDYIVIFKAISEGESDKIKSQEDFYSKRDLIAEELRLEYGRTFYRIRHQMQSKDPASWVTLLPPFSEVVKAIRYLYQQHPLAIATAKDMQSVRLLLEEYDLVQAFPYEYIFDKEAGASKRNHLTQIHKKFEVPFNAIHFIDDKVSHLQSVADLGVHCYLATWGFNKDREHQLARDLGFTLLTQDSLVQMV